MSDLMWPPFEDSWSPSWEPRTSRSTGESAVENRTFAGHYNQAMAMRTMNPVHESTSCAVAACAAIIGAKWTALLVHDLSEGPRRFSELEHSCAGISPRTLSERLRALEEEG